jgi:hypothetical protein
VSAAAAEQVVALPEIRPRSWATSIIVMIDVLALQAALFMGYLARLSLKTLFPISLGAPQYAALAIGMLTLPFAYYCLGLYPGYGIGAVQRLRVRSYTTLFVFGALLTWRYIFEGPQWSRGVLLGTALFALLIPPALEALHEKI